MMSRHYDKLHEIKDFTLNPQMYDYAPSSAGASAASSLSAGLSERQASATVDAGESREQLTRLLHV